jgi:hypothetical protein
MLAGLLRSEEPEAPTLFDQVLGELGLLFHPPVGPRAAKWAMAYWVAGQIADGTLDPTTGRHRLRPRLSRRAGTACPLRAQPGRLGGELGGLPRGTQRAGSRGGEAAPEQAVGGRSGELTVRFLLAVSGHASPWG